MRNCHCDVEEIKNIETRLKLLITELLHLEMKVYHQSVAGIQVYLADQASLLFLSSLTQVQDDVSIIPTKTLIASAL